MALSLAELVERNFLAGGKDPQGKKLLEMLEEQVIQFQVSDGEPFYVEVEEGAFQVKKGESPEKRKETIAAREEVFRDVLEGKRRLVDAAWEGGLHARIYHGRSDIYYLISCFSKIANRIPEHY